MTLPTFKVTGRSLVSQLTGTIGNHSVSPAPSQVNYGLSQTRDMFTGDIGNCWYDPGTGKTLFTFGDCLGTAWTGESGVSGYAANQHNTAAGQPTVLASSLSAGTILMTSTVGFQTAGWISIQTGSGPGGWSIFLYTGKTSTSLTGVTLWAGGGNVTAGMAVSSGDPRTEVGPLNGYRGNGAAYSSDADYAAGVTLDDFVNINGCMVESFPFTWVSTSQADIYPNPGSDFLAIDSISQVGGYLKIKTTTAHGLDGTRVSPIGPQLLIVDNSAVTTTIKNNSLVAVSTLNGTVDLGVSKAADLYNGATAARKRFAVETNTGIAIVSYSSISTGLNKQLIGCTLVSGTGTIITGGQVIQGVEGLSNYIQPAYDVINSTTFRILSYGGDRDGGLPNGFVFFNKLDLASTKHSGQVVAGCCAIPGPGASGWRQLALVQHTIYNGVPLGWNIWYCDADPRVANNWIDSGVRWPNTVHADDQMQIPTPFYDKDKHQDASTAYVYVFSGPGGQLMRCLPANVLTKASWEYWNGSGWTANNPAAAVRVIPGVPYNSISIIWWPAFSCFIMLYNEGLTLVARFSTNLTGGWSSALILLTGSEFSPSQIYIYGGYPLPFCFQAPNGAQDLYFTFTMLNGYQVYVEKISLDAVAVVTPSAPLGEQPGDKGAF